VISKISFQFQPLAPSINISFLVSGRRILQRLQPLSTTFLPLPIYPIEALTGSNHHPVSPAHSTQLALLCNPLI
jgi:hypothetical protein